VSSRRFVAIAIALTTPGCALFGDPLLGTWNLIEDDLYGPLTHTSTEEQTSTTTTLSGTLVFDVLEEGDLLGRYTQTTTVTVLGPEVNDTTSEDAEAEAEAGRESRGEYEVEVDGFDDWICIIAGSELDCEDDELNQVLFERIGEGKE